jgi:hypothetical protein
MPLGPGQLEYAACFRHGDKVGPPPDEVTYTLAIGPVRGLVLCGGAGDLGQTRLGGGIHVRHLTLMSRLLLRDL